ncbi:hypothetical protein SmJEL517_g04692 [Synchytrium microbalum]|uniref:3-oxoacyl-[acyl-carrier protein] reductase n=1 Tax=Synchytrium microbalum TaxID=1806994 RepID=A0A507BZ14_9FUNG|nr:uncharacterized protein SmJEL517_g04692 [Synchytrium microbalum]TPX32109.1 hypothetical protein SmJEL517_g04692 [Synchytrium microbalum]
MGNFYLTPEGLPSTLSPKAIALLKGLHSIPPHALRRVLEDLFRRFSPDARSATLDILLSDSSSSAQKILNEMGALSDAALEDGLATLRWRGMQTPTLFRAENEITRSMADRVEEELFRDLVEDMRRFPRSSGEVVYSSSPLSATHSPTIGLGSPQTPPPRNLAVFRLSPTATTVSRGRRAENLHETASSCVNSTLVVPGNVTKEDYIIDLFQQAASKYGKIDMVFCNAGTGAPPVNIEDLTLEQWQTVVDTNLTATFLCTREATRHMKKTGGGRIINNGSVSAYAPRPNSSPYTATKHAVLGLTKCTALDGRRNNIACTQIDIGNASTEMTARMAGGVPQANGTITVEPTMNVDNVGDAIVFIANLPPGANVLNMTIMATNMPFVGRG